MTITARHALVTGGSRGIGRGIALKLADHGVHVAINYVKDEGSAKATLEQVRARGADGFIVQADVSDPAQVERLFGRVRNEFGSLDVFVANARPEVSAFYQPPCRSASSNGTPPWIRRRRRSSSAFVRPTRSCPTTAASSPSRMRREDGMAAGNRGRGWAPRSPRSKR